jgi:hypothetical protein
MNRLFLPALSIATICVLAACSENDKLRQTRAHRFGYRTPADMTTETGEPADAKPSDTQPGTTDTPPAKPDTKPQTTPAPRKDYPYATKVPGKPGFVISPYAPYSGYVDVTGEPPGKEVACPYTSTDKAKKIFLVP